MVSIGDTIIDEMMGGDEHEIVHIKDGTVFVGQPGGADEYQQALEEYRNADETDDPLSDGPTKPTVPGSPYPRDMFDRDWASNRFHYPEGVDKEYEPGTELDGTDGTDSAEAETDESDDDDEEPAEEFECECGETFDSEAGLNIHQGQWCEEVGDDEEDEAEPEPEPEADGGDDDDAVDGAISADGNTDTDGDQATINDALSW